MTSLRDEVALIVRNDLRLQWRDLKGSMGRSGVLVLAFGVVCLTGVSFVMAFGHRRELLLRNETVAWAFFALFMAGVAMQLTLRTLFERADFDLLLSSPVSSRAVMLARLTSIGLGVALNAAMLLVPLIAVFSLMLGPRYLAGFGVYLLLAAGTSCFGIWATLGLVRWLGPRRAKIWAQVGGAVLGAGVYLAFQLPQLLPEDRAGRVMERLTRLGEMRGFVTPALAGRGDWASLLMVAMTAAVAVVLTARLLSRLFVEGVQESLTVGPSRRRAARKFRFVDRLSRATFWKDLRLIARDPLLLSSVLPSVLYLMPLLLPVRRVGGGDFSFYLALGGYLVMVQLSLRLAEVAANGEEGWDLIRGSPAGDRPMRFGKIAAGMALPGAFCVAAAVAVAFLGRPGVGAFTILTGITATAAGCWIVIADVRPTPRKDLIQRKGGMKQEINLRGIFVALFFMGIGALAIGAGLRDAWLWAWVVYGVLALFSLACFALIRIKDIDWEKVR